MRPYCKGPLHSKDPSKTDSWQPLPPSPSIQCQRRFPATWNYRKMARGERNRQIIRDHRSSALRWHPKTGMQIPHTIISKLSDQIFSTRNGPDDETEEAYPSTFSTSSNSIRRPWLHMRNLLRTPKPKLNQTAKPLQGWCDYSHSRRTWSDLRCLYAQPYQTEIIPGHPSHSLIILSMFLESAWGSFGIWEGICKMRAFWQQRITQRL